MGTRLIVRLTYNFVSVKLGREPEIYHLFKCVPHIGFVSTVTREMMMILEIYIL